MGVFLKSYFTRQGQFFLILKELGCRLHDIKKGDLPIHYIILDLFLYIKEKTFPSSLQMEIAGLLCVLDLELCGFGIF